MDTMLSLNGDFKTDSHGRAYLSDHTEELLQKIYILLSAKKNQFIYNRTLGSEIQTQISEEKILAEARNALRQIPEAEVLRIISENDELNIIIQINQQEYSVTVRR